MSATGLRCEPVPVKILNTVTSKTVNSCMSHYCTYTPIAKQLPKTGYRDGREWNFTLCACPNHRLF